MPRVFLQQRQVVKSTIWPKLELIHSAWISFNFRWSWGVCYRPFNIFVTSQVQQPRSMSTYPNLGGLRANSNQSYVTTRVELSQLDNTQYYRCVRANVAKCPLPLSGHNSINLGSLIKIDDGPQLVPITIPRINVSTSVSCYVMFLPKLTLDTSKVRWLIRKDVNTLLVRRERAILDTWDHT